MTWPRGCLLIRTNLHYPVIKVSCCDLIYLICLPASPPISRRVTRSKSFRERLYVILAPACNKPALLPHPCFYNIFKCYSINQNRYYLIIKRHHIEYLPECNTAQRNLSTHTTKIQRQNQHQLPRSSFRM